MMKKALKVLLSLSGVALISSAAIVQKADADDSQYWASQCYELDGRAGFQACDRALELNAGDARLWTERGAKLDGDFEQYDRALASYDRALELNADYSLAWYNRCSTAIALQSYQEAVGNCDRALSGDGNWGASNPAMAWYNRGLALGELGRLEAELASYDRAVALNPQHAKAWANRGLALSKLGQKEEARASYQQALAIDPREDLAQSQLNLLEQG